VQIINKYLSDSKVIAEKTNRERLIAYSFIAPALLIFIFITAIPTLAGIYYSFTDWSGLAATIKLVGFDNYQRLVKDSVFLTAIKNTLIITAIVVFFQNTCGLLLAILLNKENIIGRNFFRSVFFIPSLFCIIVTGYTWLYILNVHIGVVGLILKGLGIGSVVGFDVFLRPLPALLTISFVTVWQFSGYSMMIYLAGLQTIPSSLYEAAELDGAGPWQKFKNVTFPLIIPSLTVNVTLSLVACLKIFEQVYVMTKGGPGNMTETIGTFIYNSAFSSNQMAYGCAISTVLFFGILILTTIQLKFSRSKEVEL
jgi:raffinose/stachyose/melibiose transport system permease protein